MYRATGYPPERAEFPEPRPTAPPQAPRDPRAAAWHSPPRQNAAAGHPDGRHTARSAPTSAVVPPTAATDVGPHSPAPPAPEIRLPLYVELYLVAHHSFDGAPLLHRTQLGAGLGAAVLLDLWFDRHLAITGTGPASRHGPPPLMPLGGPPPADPLLRNALDTLRALDPGHPDPVRGLLYGAAEGLHTSVGEALLDAGILQRTTSRRLGFIPAHTILPAQPAWGVRATARIRNAITGLAEADDRCAALGGLMSCLDLTDILHLDQPQANARSWLHEHAAQRGSAFGQVLAALDAVRGDLAVAAMH